MAQAPSAPPMPPAMGGTSDDHGSFQGVPHAAPAKPQSKIHTLSLSLSIMMHAYMLAI